MDSYAARKIEALIGVLARGGRVFIQPHDFPDPDAIAACFGLQGLLALRGVKAQICYAGFMERELLRQMCLDFSIELLSNKDVSMSPQDLVVIVDGCKHNRNVTDLPGEEVAVIDHHQVERPDDVPYCDIRSDYGSASTIIFDYYSALGEKPDKQRATAMMIGLLTDTAKLTRGCSQADVAAYSGLWPLADMDYVKRYITNCLSLDDLSYIGESIGKLRVRDNFGFIFLEKDCARNLMGIMGDFFLGMNELDFVVIASCGPRGVSVSARSELGKWNAAHIVSTALQGRGTGGGHADMAGGFIPGNPEAGEIFEAFENILFPLA